MSVGRLADSSLRVGLPEEVGSVPQTGRMEKIISLIFKGVVAYGFYCLVRRGPEDAILSAKTFFSWAFCLAISPGVGKFAVGVDVLWNPVFKGGRDRDMIANLCVKIFGLICLLNAQNETLSRIDNALNSYASRIAKLIVH